MAEMPKLTVDEWHTISVALSASQGVYGRMMTEFACDPESMRFFGMRSAKATDLAFKLRPYIDAAMKVHS